MDNLVEIKNEINSINSAIDSLIYGSIEIRNLYDKKYIYVHYRINGLLRTKYAGEYSEELHNLILSNNIRVKELKSRLKELNKKLSELSITSKKLDDNVLLNIDLARKNLVNSIYKQSILEGVITTYSDTETIVNEGKVHDMNYIDVLKMINLKHAWEFILDYDVECCPTNYELLCQINRFVQEGISYSAGKIRSTPVSIGGTSFIPPLPAKSQIVENLNLILNDSSNDEIRKAATLIAYTMKLQAFIDGNKRTAVIFGNHYLISHGLGLIVVPVEKISEYKKLLIEFYESKSDKLIEFLKNDCYLPLK